MMIRNRVLQFTILFSGLVLGFTACAQDHQKNEQRLTQIKQVKESTVLLNNQGGTIPLMHLEACTIASVNLNFSQTSAFDSLLSKYAKITSFSADKYKGKPNLDELEDDLKFFNTVIISISDKEVGNAIDMYFINNVAKTKNVVIALFGNGPALAAFDQLNIPIIWSQQQNDEAAMYAAQAIFGGVALQQKLGKSFSAKYTAGKGSVTQAIRLGYTVPEEQGVNANDLREIDDIVAEAIAQRATPGAVVLVAKDGKVIFNKAYGYHTYEKVTAEKVNDIFDLASVTKTSATTQAVMRLYETGKLKLDTNIGAYIPRARNTNKNDIKVREVMLHQAGFIPFIPFFQALKPGDLSRDSSALYCTKVADSCYIRKGYYDEVMWPKMLDSELKTRGKYVYSDISMYVMKDIVERITQEHLENYVWSQFYKPLGMYTAGFLPRNRFDKAQIVPTELDKYFRKTLLWGYVHDQGAAMLGGVSGHAGLFSTANDMAILYQMLLNKGTYGGTQYFKPETVDLFTAKQSDVSRRGLGFDRWDPDPAKKYPSELASPLTYGHTGYTGTCVWVDPKSNLVYVFLSNRVHPEVSDKLLKLSTRSKIHDVIYKAINSGK